MADAGGATLTELRHKNTSIVKTSKYENDESWHVSMWHHRAWFVVGCATVLITLSKSLFLTATNSQPWLDTMFAAFIGYITADLATGIYHWAIDNYGSANTPIFGSQIESFQSHHQQPWAITTRHLANNLYIPAAAVTAFVTPINLVSNDAVLLGFVGVFASCIVFSQLFHAWAHTPKRKLPAVVVALQDAGIIVGRVQHAAHHRPPYNSSYCIVSGLWNRFLDKSKFFVGLEVFFAAVVGVRPRSWNDPTADWAPVSVMD